MLLILLSLLCQGFFWLLIIQLKLTSPKSLFFSFSLRHHLSHFNTAFLGWPHPSSKSLCLMASSSLVGSSSEGGGRNSSSLAPPPPPRAIPQTSVLSPLLFSFYSPRLTSSNSTVFRATYMQGWHTTLLLFSRTFSSPHLHPYHNSAYPIACQIFLLGGAIAISNLVCSRLKYFCI